MSAIDEHVDEQLRKIRLCVLDVDGTVLNSRHQVSTGTHEAIAAVRAAGIEVMLATSRAPIALVPILEELEGVADTPFIASQGAVLGRLNRAGQVQVELHSPAPLASALAVVDNARAVRIAVSWYTPSEWLVTSVDSAVMREAEITHSKPKVADLATQSRGPDKLMLISEPTAIEVLESLRTQIPHDLHAQFSNPNYLEVTAAGVDKATTLAAYCDPSGLQHEHVLAMGDGPNDLGLFKLAGVSAAPANARPEVLKAATFKAPSNDEGGVAHVLNRVACLADS